MNRDDFDWPTLVIGPTHVGVVGSTVVIWATHPDVTLHGELIVEMLAIDGGERLRRTYTKSEFDGFMDRLRADKGER